jgi:CHAT domain-containing protein/Tfp pilus assembly protein PilF
VLALVCAVSTLAARSQSLAVDSERAIEAIRQDLERGAFAEAERQSRALYAGVVMALGPESLPAVQTLEVLLEALTAAGRAGTEEALSVATRIVPLKERYFHSDDLELSRSLHIVGAVYTQRGDFQAAVPLHDRALKIRLRAPGSNDQAVADSLDYLALPLIRLEKFSEARLAVTRSLKLREARSEQFPLSLANTLEVLALLHRYSGNYAEGVASVDRAIAIRRNLTPLHPALASLLRVRGDLLWLQGDIVGSQRVYREALVMSEEALQPKHPSMAVLLRMLGLADEAFGNLADARRLRERAVSAADGLAPCHPERAGVLSDLAKSLKSEGDYIEAEKLYRRALIGLEKCLGVTHSLTATVVYNLGNLMREMGDLAEAERLHERAVRDWSASVGPNHPYVARAIDSLAETVAARGQRTRARALYEQALQLRRRTLGPEHPDITSTLINLARVVTDMGQAGAITYLDEAEAILSRPGVSAQPQRLSSLLTVRGSIEIRRGEYAAARASFAAALVQRERMYGAAHPLVAETRADLAVVEMAVGSYDLALTNAVAAEQIGREHLRATIRYLPERQAMAYAARRPRALDLMLSVAASDASVGSASLLDVVIQSRGVILDELIARGGAIRASDRQVESLNATAVRARQRFANLVVRSLQESVPAVMLDDARQQKEDVERALAESSAEARAESRRADIGFRDVDWALPHNSVLVSFVLYDRTKATPKALRPTTLRPVRSYGAFVHEAGTSDVAFVPLGTAAWIDGLIKAWRIEAAGGSTPDGPSRPETDQAYRTAAVALRRAVWDPLSIHLEGAARTFVVPDGRLNIVNIAALPDRSGRYLVERQSVIHYLSTERDLVAFAHQTPSRGLLAVGGPQFGGRPTTIVAGTSARRSGCDDFGSTHFSDLPGSRREVSEISKLWPAQGPDDVRMLSGSAATETAVKQTAGGSRVVHLATHGFFLGGDCPLGGAGTRSVGGLTKRVSVKEAATVTENPLSLAGLAFAGANQRRSVRGDLDDGILTAEEIGGLNLQGTEWAVLSACDTGLGEIKAGEGVFGLRRAFQVAGARTVIMSLWSVEDRSAMEWMKALYQGRLQRGLDTAEAVREASLTVLRQRRARGQSTHPFYWAGFVAAGDWR